MESMLCGRVLSTTSMSLENRDNIRPVGVISKKFSGARNTPCNSALCSSIAACVSASCGNKSLATDPIAGKE